MVFKLTPKLTLDSSRETKRSGFMASYSTATTVGPVSSSTSESLLFHIVSHHIVTKLVQSMLYTNIPKFEELELESRELYHGGKEQYIQTARRHGASLLYAKSGSQDEMWVPLIEKAYAKFYGSFAHLERGWTREAMEDLTGGVATAFITKDILDKDRFWREELVKANKDRLFACSFNGFGSGEGGGTFTVDGLHGDHAYAILRAVECRGKRFVVLRNPWGKGEWTGAWSDGSKEWTPEWLGVLAHLDHTFGNDGQFVMDCECSYCKTKFHHSHVICLLRPRVFEILQHHRANLSV